ncbi:unnamed protein product [Adineta ricciae]|uniref:Glycosyl transferase CAP10 domain-containing protein n=1 Tax=Adineta ricciae TaxID=249248 RepID=A0A813X8H1_ADIRI|nr:unnamed protein product [Adineta ricciae]CAF1251252.1 unnamed protein product [Adineta ricciae]
MYGSQHRLTLLLCALLLFLILTLIKLPNPSKKPAFSNCHFIFKPFFNYLCDGNSFGPFQVSNDSHNHVCYQLYSKNKHADLFARVQLHFQPFSNRKILFSDIENLSNSCLSCHHIQIIQNKLYIIPRPNAFNYQTRSRSVKLLIKQMMDTFPNTPDLDLFFSVQDMVDLPNGLNGVRFNVPIFAFAKTTRTKVGLRSDAVIPMPCFTLWSWPETRAGRWTDRSQSIVSAAQKIGYKNRIPKLFWRGVWNWKRLWYIDLAKENPDIMDIKDVSWNATANGVAHRASNAYVTLEGHCDYKYLAHLEGSSYSSRLKYLLLCGSPVVYNPVQYWEEHWYHLLKDRENIIVFESARNEAALKKLLDHLSHNENKMKRIGQKGQQLVLEYLSEHAVSCYWWKLMHEYAKLLGYQPTLHPDAIHIDDFLIGTLS